MTGNWYLPTFCLFLNCSDVDLRVNHHKTILFKLMKYSPFKQHISEFKLKLVLFWEGRIFLYTYRSSYPSRKAGGLWPATHFAETHWRLQPKTKVSCVLLGLKEFWVKIAYQVWEAVLHLITQGRNTHNHWYKDIYQIRKFKPLACKIKTIGPNFSISTTENCSPHLPRARQKVSVFHPCLLELLPLLFFG